MNGFNLSEASDIKLGGSTITALYLGSNKLWPTTPPDPYSLIPVTIENVSDNDVTLTATGYGSGTYELYYSEPFDETMLPPEYEYSSSIIIESPNSYQFITLSPGEMVRLWAEDNNSVKSTRNYYSITSDGPINIYGNIKSLLDMHNKGLSMANYCLINYFKGAMVVDASHLVLPDTTLSSYCYQYMFQNCTSLTTAPNLPATTLARNCYQAMFMGCTSLTTPPTISATTLARNCCASMFRDDTALTTAPDLLATTLEGGCYQYMFKNCASLQYIKCLATVISTTSDTYNMMSLVAATGTFVKSASMTSWPSGANGIPSGWTVIDV